MSKFVQQAAGMAAGAVVVTTSYQDAVEAREAERAAKMNADTVIETVVEDTEQDDFIGDIIENSGGNEETDEGSSDEMEPADSDEDFDEEENISDDQEDNSNTEKPSSNNTNTGVKKPDSTNGKNNPAETASSSVKPQDTTKPVTPQLEVESLTWEWSDENVTLFIIDGTGKEHHIPATVTTEETPASCTEDGEITYSAVAEYENNEYTDTKTETISATGHLFGEGEVTSDGTKTVREYQCEICGEKFVIELTIDEDD